MNKSLQDMIDDYKNGLLETRNLQISNEKFLTEVGLDCCTMPNPKTHKEFREKVVCLICLKKPKL